MVGLRTGRLFKACLRLFVLGALSCSVAWAGDGKILATAGLSSIEGAGGGGIVPWATLSGYDTEEQVSASVFSSHVGVQDYTLQAWGAAIGLYDRFELSAARHRFDIKPLGLQIQQNILGAKARLYGNLVYGDLPQISVGLQHKRLLEQDVAQLLGADESQSGTDYYLAASKVHLGAALGYNLVWNLTLRSSKANQLGLLGYGGAGKTNRDLLAEASLGVFLNRRLAVGMEFRQKPDNLGLKEDHWRDVFISYMPNKQMNLTIAWADLGNVAIADKQEGLYVSLTGYLW